MDKLHNTKSNYLYLCKAKYYSVIPKLKQLYFTINLIFNLQNSLIV